MSHLNVAYITDQNFVVQCGISLTSLIINNPDLDLDIYFLDGGINKEDRKKIQQVWPEVHFIDVRDYAKKSSAFQYASGFQPIVFARLLLTEYLPDAIETILYMDGDTIVDGSLKELADIYLSDDQYVGAVPEVYMPVKTMKASIGFEKEDVYYNAGVLLINLRQWRKKKLGTQMIQYLQQSDKPLPFNDQDIINLYCRNHIKTLEPSFNMNPNLPYFPIWFVKKNFLWFQKIPRRDEYLKMIKHPIIIHYMGDERPWIIGNFNFYGNIWKKYRLRSCWNEFSTAEKGKVYVWLYHGLNRITFFFPQLRIAFSNLIGINIRRWRDTGTRELKGREK